MMESLPVLAEPFRVTEVSEQGDGLIPAGLGLWGWWGRCGVYGDDYGVFARHGAVIGYLEQYGIGPCSEIGQFRPNRVGAFEQAAGAGKNGPLPGNNRVFTGTGRTVECDREVQRQGDGLASALVSNGRRGRRGRRLR